MSEAFMVTVGVVYSDTSEVGKEAFLRSREEAAVSASDLVRRTILRNVPLNKVCSLVIGEKTMRDKCACGEFLQPVEMCPICCEVVPNPQKNPALVATIDRGWQKLAEAQPEKYKSKFDMLFDMYVNQGMSQPEIGKRLGKCGHTINKQCKKLGIKMRPRGGANNPWGRTGKRKKRNGLVVPRSAEDVRVRY